MPALRLPENGRCKLHAGRSTGPRTAAALLALARRSTRHGYYARATVEWRRGMLAIFARLGEALAALPDTGLPIMRSWHRRRGPLPREPD